MTDLTALVGELEAMQERLRASRVIQKGEPVSLHLADGTIIEGTTGDLVQTRNPDGPAAADAIGKAIATLKAQREALEPFANSWVWKDDGDEDDVLCRSENGCLSLRVEHFRRARASIEGNPTA